MNKEIKEINNSKENLKDKLKDEISDLKKLKNSASPEGFFSGIKQEFSKIKESLLYKEKSKKEIISLNSKEKIEKGEKINESKKELINLANVVIHNPKLDSKYDKYLENNPDLIGQVYSAKDLHNDLENNKNDPYVGWAANIANNLLS